MRGTALTAGILVASLASSSPAEAGQLRLLHTITETNGMIHDALAFDESGSRLATITTDNKGNVVLRVGPPGGKPQATTDLSRFTVVPERIVFLGGNWFVIANDGERKAAVVAGGKIKTSFGPFGDALVSTARGKNFVTVTERAGKAGERSHDIAVYRPDGNLIWNRQVTIGANAELVGYPGKTWVSFTDGFLGALVRVPGAYNPTTDVRGPASIAVYDIMSGRIGPGRILPNIPRFVNFAQTRNERPGFETFVRVDDDHAGLELVGPAEKVRELPLDGKLASYEHGSLVQQAAGKRIFFSLTLDPLNAEQVAAGKKGQRVLHLYGADIAKAKASRIGEIVLGESQGFAWAAGGNRIAVLKKTLANGGNEVLVFDMR